MDEIQTTFWARIEDGVVREIVPIDPEGRFHPSLFFMACGADVQQGWTYTNGVFSPPQQGEA